MSVITPRSAIGAIGVVKKKVVITVENETYGGRERDLAVTCTLEQVVRDAWQETGKGANVQFFSVGARCFLSDAPAVREMLALMVEKKWINTMTLGGVGFKSKAEWESVVAFLTELRKKHDGFTAAVIVFGADQHEKVNDEIRGEAGVIEMTPTGLEAGTLGETLMATIREYASAGPGADTLGETLMATIREYASAGPGVPTYYVMGKDDTKYLEAKNFDALLTSHSNLGQLFLDGSNFLVGGKDSGRVDHLETNAWVAARELSLSLAKACDRLICRLRPYPVALSIALDEVVVGAAAKAAFEAERALTVIFGAGGAGGAGGAAARASTAALLLEALEEFSPSLANACDRLIRRLDPHHPEALCIALEEVGAAAATAAALKDAKAKAKRQATAFKQAEKQRLRDGIVLTAAEKAEKAVQPALPALPALQRTATATFGAGGASSLARASTAAPLLEAPPRADPASPPRVVRVPLPLPAPMLQRAETSLPPAKRAKKTLRTR